MPALPVLVTGGTGTLGRHVVPLLRDAGRPVRVLSRRHNEPADGIEFVTGDLLEDDGIEPAVDGVGTIVHPAGGPNAKGRRRGGPQPGAGRGAGRRAAPGVPLGRRGRPDPARLLQVQAARGAGGGRVRPAVDDAACHPGARLGADRGAEAGDAAGHPGPGAPAPAGRLRRGGGPARGAGARQAGRPGARPDRADGVRDGRVRPRLPAGLRQASALLPVWVPGRAGRAYRSGENLALPGAELGNRTWEDFLVDRVTV